jgi:hypothetical protein
MKVILIASTPIDEESQAAQNVLIVSDPILDAQPGDYDRIEFDVTGYPDEELQDVKDWIAGVMDGKSYTLQRLLCRCVEQLPCVAIPEAVS